MNPSFFASRFGVILAATSLALTSSGVTTLTASAASSLEDAQVTEATLQRTSSVDSPYQLADNESDDDGDDDIEANESDDGDAGDDDDQADGEVSVESLPNAIATNVLEDVAKRTGMQVSQLKIIKVARQTWNDGCLGLGDGICTQALVPGWQVIVAGESQLWAYRCNESGTLVKYDQALSQTLTSRVASEVSRRREVMTRTTQTTQTVTGASGSQSTQVIGTTQGGGVSTSTQRQTTATRSTAQISFVDIPANYWARDFIAELARLEIIDGFPDGQFRPNEPVTRAQFAAMVRKAFKVKKNKVRNAISFRDVSVNHWAYSAIRDCYELGFLNAISGNEFNPSESLTRLQILVALTQGLNYTATSSTENMLQLYSDAASVPSSVRTLIAAATERGIVVNYPNVSTLSPNTVATRAEVAAFLYQAMVSTGDAVAISSPYVAGTEFGVIEQRQTGEVREVDRELEVEREVEVEREAEVERELEVEREVETEMEQGDRNKPRQNCNQGIGNGAEGCDPGNSRPHGGSNDEGGRTPGNRP